MNDPKPTRHQSIALVHPKGSVIPFPPLMSDVNLKNGNSIYSSSNQPYGCSNTRTSLEMDRTLDFDCYSLGENQFRKVTVQKIYPKGAPGVLPKLP